MNINDLIYEIRGAIYAVHNELGPGLLESVYEAALLQEFKINEIQALNQVAVGIKYKGVKLDIGFRIDILVEDLVIIEIKSVKVIEDVHKKQLLTYLKLANKKMGILVNFNSAKLIDKESLIRIIR